MAHPLLLEYLSDKKDSWLKLRTKSPDDEPELLAQANVKFDPENWLPQAAIAASGIRVSSHPVTFSHPSAKRSGNDTVSAVIHQAQFAPDGYWRSGNAVVANDAMVNAADLPVYGFLMLCMEDGRSVLEHIVANTSEAKALLTIQSTDTHTLREGFLSAIKSEGEEAVSSPRLKQVYFPLGNDDYHLLSVVMPSTLVYATRQRIESRLFSESAKAAREHKKSGLYFQEGFSEFFNLTVAVYGGDNPQNISAANTKGNGKTLLLESMPPELDPAYFRVPRTDFFRESLSRKGFGHHFTAFHTLITEHSAMDRASFLEARDDIIYQVMLDVVEYAFEVREGSRQTGQGADLPYWQQVWLLHSFSGERAISQTWLDDVADGCTTWFIHEYKRRVKEPLSLAGAEMAEIKKVISRFIMEQKELFV